MATRLPDVGLRGYQNPARTVTTGSVDSTTSLNIAGTDAAQPMEFTVQVVGDAAWIYVSATAGSPPSGYVKSVKVAIGAVSTPIQLGAGQFACVVCDIAEAPCTATIKGTNVTVTGGL